MKLSILQNYTSTSPRECGMEDVVPIIRSDANLKCLTDGFRSTGNRHLKESAPCFVPACRLEGGKQLKHVTALTGLSMADFDHLEASRIEELRSKVNSDPHTLISYVTISGRGLRVVFRYELDVSVPMDKQMLFYRKAFVACNAHYSQLLGMESDGQCKNITRLSGMAHDPLVFFRPDAEVFSSEWIAQQNDIAVNSQRERKRIERERMRLDRLFDSSIAPELEAEGAVYAPGSHNDYVMRVGYRLNQWAVPLDSAVSWAAERFSDYDGTEQVVRSCYQRTEEHGSRKFHRKRERAPAGREQPVFASVEEIKEFLAERIRLRFNVITSRVEYHSEIKN